MSAPAPAGESSASRQAALRAFRRELLMNPELAAPLGDIDTPREFVKAAGSLARSRGIALEPDDLQLRAPATALSHWPAPGWAPSRCVCTQAGPAIDWLWLGDDPLVLPFYEDHLRRARARPLNRFVHARTSVDDLVAHPDRDHAAEPAGFIFHMSRCGSTLLAQMLARVPGHRMVSEPEPLDAIIQWAAGASSQSARVAALRSIVGALGRDAGSRRVRLFVKLDAWHALALPLLREVFPHVPWLFLYREPLEVMASHLRMPGSHIVPGLLPAHAIGVEQGGSTSREDYCARVLGSICQAIVRHWPLGGGLLVNYSDLRDALPRHLLPHFGLTPAAGEVAAMQAASRLHSKTSEPFSPEPPQLSDVARIAVEAYLRPVYRQLEAMRLACSEGRFG
jgi:hypothetical protein